VRDFLKLEFMELHYFKERKSIFICEDCINAFNIIKLDEQVIAKEQNYKGDI